jgi:hypothetical protein
VVFGRPVNYRLLLSFSDLIQLISVRKTKTVKKNWKKRRRQREDNKTHRQFASQARQDKTRQDKTKQDKTKQEKTRQDKTRQDKARQGKTRQDKPRQDKPRQDRVGV